MRSRKANIFSIILISIVLISMLSVTGCSSDKSTTTSGEKTITIGAILWLGMTLGLDAEHGIQLTTDQINESGGLDIGGEKYKINVIYYDDNNAADTARSAMNRLVFQDNVKFIISGSMFEPALYQIAEDNKVVFVGSSTQDDILNPDLKYCFRGNPGACFETVLPAWMVQRFPEKKNWAVVCEDSQSGRQSGSFVTKVLEGSGASVDIIYIPSNATDLSAMATKVKELNPDVFMPSLSVEGDTLAFKAVYQVGYKGQIFFPGAHSVEAMLAMVPPECIEGLIKGEDPVHLEPPGTQMAADFKAAWIAKYGSWTKPALFYYINFMCMKAALEKAGSTDPDKVADVIANGLQWDAASGSYQMIDRPDKNNSRTIDCVEDCYPVRVVNSQIELIEHLSLADSYEIYHKFNQ
jgi:branched-chain amino acid transport system substrate-binding protein